MIHRFNPPPKRAEQKFCKNLILIEGYDDAEVIENYASQELGVDPGILSLFEFNGTQDNYQNLQAAFKRLLYTHSETPFTQIGIILDSEGKDKETIERNIKKLLSGHGLPTNILKILVLEPALEKILMESVSANRLYQCVNKFITCAESHGAWESKANSRMWKLKAEVSAYTSISRHKKHDHSIGHTSRKSQNIWNFQSNAFSELKVFLSHFKD